MLKWNIEEQEVTQKMVSSDARWHISKRHNKEADNFFLTNFNLLLTPNGVGADYKECFQSFIDNCDSYIEKVKQIQQEAKEHLNQMNQIEKELTHEN